MIVLEPCKGSAPDPSVTVKLYIPATRLFIVDPDAVNPFGPVQLMLKFPSPPLMVPNVMEPLAAEKQFTLTMLPPWAIWIGKGPPIISTGLKI